MQLLVVDGLYMSRLSASKRPGDGFCSWMRSAPPPRSQPGRLSWRRTRTISGRGSRVRRLDLHAVAQLKVGRRWSRSGLGGRRSWGTSSRTSCSVKHAHRRPPGRANGLDRRKCDYRKTRAQRQVFYIVVERKLKKVRTLRSKTLDGSISKAVTLTACLGRAARARRAAATASIPARRRR